LMALTDSARPSDRVPRLSSLSRVFANASRKPNSCSRSPTMISRRKSTAEQAQPWHPTGDHPLTDVASDATIFQVVYTRIETRASQGVRDLGKSEEHFKLYVGLIEQPHLQAGERVPFASRWRASGRGPPARGWLGFRLRRRVAGAEPSRFAPRCLTPAAALRAFPPTLPS
jgi:hypothetical protein